MDRTDSPLICTQQPSLEQGCHQMHFGKQVVTNIGFCANDFVNVAQFVDSIVTLPSISLDNAPRFNIILYDILQAIPRCIRNSLKTNSSKFEAIFLCSYYNEFFTCGTTPSFTRFFSANEGFIYFNDTTETVTSRVTVSAFLL
jgi:hypothetical protein